MTLARREREKEKEKERTRRATRFRDEPYHHVLFFEHTKRGRKRTPDLFKKKCRWGVGVRRHPESGESELLEGPVSLLDGLKVSSHETLHSVPSCAWSVKLADKPGRFDREKADAIGLGIEQVSLLADGQDVEFSGQLYNAADFRAASKSGLSVLISGDTKAGVPSFEELGKAGKGPDLLIHEATYTDIKQDKADEWMHSTARDAAKAAVISHSMLWLKVVLMQNLMM